LAPQKQEQEETKVNKTESEIIESVAKCEQLLLLLGQSTQGFRTIKNETITHNVEIARRSAIHCLEKMASKEMEQAKTLGVIAVLRASFASQAFEAERTQMLLGEGDFLELHPAWQKASEDALREMEHALDAMRSALTGKS
jgi:hypothetical protein